MNDPVEDLRVVWTPGQEVEEVVQNLDPQTELDSMIRHFLHAIVQKYGPFTINLEDINVGNLRWEIIHGPGPYAVRNREVTLWVENSHGDG